MEGITFLLGSSPHSAEGLTKKGNLGALVITQKSKQDEGKDDKQQK